MKTGGVHYLGNEMNYYAAMFAVRGLGYDPDKNAYVITYGKYETRIEGDDIVVTFPAGVLKK